MWHSKVHRSSLTTEAVQQVSSGWGWLAGVATSLKKMAATRSRVVGSLMGLAVCDAVGTTVEFMPPGSFKPVTEMEGGGIFSLLSGQVSTPVPGVF